MLLERRHLARRLRSWSYPVLNGLGGQRARLKAGSPYETLQTVCDLEVKGRKACTQRYASNDFPGTPTWKDDSFVSTSGARC